MRSPVEIAVEAVREEVRAGEVFTELIGRGPAAVRSAVERDPALRTGAMARRLLDYCEGMWESVPAEHLLEYLHAAEAAAAGGEAHIRFRLAKVFANTYRSLGRFAEAEAALHAAESLLFGTLAPEVHEGVLAFAWLALRHDRGEPIDPEELETTIRKLEQQGALDRAYDVRLFDAVMKAHQGRHYQALVAYEDAARRALECGADADLERAYWNRGHCFRALADYAAAKEEFAKAAEVANRNGWTVLEAKALRCVARMAIRLRGEDGIAEMERAKQLFLSLGMAAEVCRATLAVMEEMSHRDPAADLRPLARQLEEELALLGLTLTASGALGRLHEAVVGRTVTEDLIEDVWNVFGQSHGVTTVSAMEMVRN